jgi:pyrroline-5-carboxylate reductase
LQVDRVLLSPRNNVRVRRLASAHANVEVCPSAQEVADRVDIVVVAVRPEDCGPVLGGLTFGLGSVVVSVMAGVRLGQLREAIPGDVAIVRAMPLTTVRHLDCVTVLLPSHEVVCAVFDALGGSVVVEDEEAFDVFTTLTSTVSTQLAYIREVWRWAASRGIERSVAERFVRSQFAALGRELAAADDSLDLLMGRSETPGGFNEQLRTTWFSEANSSALREALDGVRSRL